MSPARLMLVLTVAIAVVVVGTHQPVVPVVLLPTLIGLLVASADRRLHDPLRRPWSWVEWRTWLRRRATEARTPTAAPARKAMDERRILLSAVACLLVLGAVMVWSASARPGVPSLQHLPSQYLLRYAWCGAVGLLLMWMLSRGGVELLRRFMPVLLVGSFALLLLVLVPGVGIEVNGARRWLGFGSFAFEPAELVKLPLVLYVAHLVAARPRAVALPRHRLQALAAVAVSAALLVAEQPDLGTAATICLVAAAMLVVAGIQLRYLAYAAAAAFVLLMLLALLQPYQLHRLSSFLDPWADASSSGFQAVQSQIAFGSGGLFGLGIGNSIQKAFYLPEAHTDFILAVLGEELGAVGVMSVVVLFALMAWSGLRIARAAEDVYEKLLASGLTAMVVGQAALNMFVVLGLAPVTGIPLPFISYGPTSMIVSLAAVGLLLDVERRRRQALKPARALRQTHVGLVDRRMGLLFLTLLASLGVAELRETWIVTARAPALRRVGATQHLARVVVPARRGTIMDRHHFQLAISHPAWDVVATPPLIDHPRLVARGLAIPLHQSVAALTSTLAQHDVGFLYVARQVSRATRDAVYRRFEGISVLPTMVRRYPRSPLAANLVGGVGIDQRGLWGVEAALDQTLSGRDGLRQIVSNALGGSIAIDDLERVRPGHGVQLTIDAGLQELVERVLGGVGRTTRPEGAAALVLDVRSGDVLALADWPGVDPERPGEATAAALREQATQSVFEPRATFDVFPVAASIEEGIVQPDDIVQVPAAIKFSDRLKIEGPGGSDEDLTVSQIVEQVRDLGTVAIALRLGGARFGAWMRRFGFGRQTGVGVPGEQPGTLPEVDAQTVSLLGSLSIGQGQTVTLMQLAAAYATIADGGVLHRPQVVARINDEPVRRPADRTVMSSATADAVREMLSQRGGGVGAEAPLVEPKTGLYSTTRRISVYVGIAPTRRPRFVVAVLLVKPQADGVADATARTITRFALPYLGIGAESVSP